MSTYLSKSDFKVARTCAAKLYYKKLGYPSARDDDEYLRFLADGGYMIEAIAKLLHPEGIEIGFENGPEASFEETMNALRANDTVTLFEATLIFEGRLARVDILKKTGNRFDLIEVKAKSVDTSKEGHPFRGARGKITSTWQPYLEDAGLLVLLANITLDADQKPIFDPIVKELPEYLQETAFLDRLRGIIPGWDRRCCVPDGCATRSGCRQIVVIFFDFFFRRLVLASRKINVWSMRSMLAHVSFAASPMRIPVW